MKLIPGWRRWCETAWEVGCSFRSVASSTRYYPSTDIRHTKRLWEKEGFINFRFNFSVLYFLSTKSILILGHCNGQFGSCFINILTLFLSLCSIHLTLYKLEKHITYKVASDLSPIQNPWSKLFFRKSIFPAFKTVGNRPPKDWHFWFPCDNFNNTWLVAILSINFLLSIITNTT